MNISAKKALVADFIAKCNGYADAKLARYREQVAAASGQEALALQDKIGHWTAYRTFNEHTLRELAGTELDDWFG
jgi:hypothetical protein